MHEPKLERITLDGHQQDSGPILLSAWARVEFKEGKAALAHPSTFKLHRNHPTIMHR